MDTLTNDIHDLSDSTYESETKLRRNLTKILKDRLSRRELLKAGGLTGVSVSALWALACQPAAPARTPTKAPVAVAPTPTPPPAPPTSTPTKAPPATPTPEKIGKHLIGKLEGPELITDSAKWPKTFKEAPSLAELVKAGKLPPVKERIGEEPLVLKPLHEVGKYGGTWRRGFVGPGDWPAGPRAFQFDKILYFDYAGTKVVPNMAKGWEVSTDGRTTTIFLRRGMKWSDGKPFTADDFIFWYEDVYLNKDLNPSPMVVMTINFKPVTMEKVDTYTVRWRAPDPYYILPVVLAGVMQLNSHSREGHRGLGGFAPAYYLKQFHPKYVSKEELDKKVKEAKFDNWVSLFKAKNNANLNVELPVITAWKLSSPINTPTWALERNPYSVWVDTEGNQLPYIDKAVCTLGENLEIINLRAIAGEYDEQARHIDLSKLPVFLENQKKGDYRIWLDPSTQGGDVVLFFNQSYVADSEVAKWLTSREFRIALSQGIQREQINETFFLGLGVPGSNAPGEETLYSPGPEYRTLHSTYDVKKANEMLDKIGLDKKDSEGYRLRTDGKGRLRLEVITFVGFIPFTQMLEMVREQWKRIGIQIDVVELERGLKGRRVAANETQIVVETQWGGDDMFAFFPNRLFPYNVDSEMGPVYGTWFSTGGKSGKEPPPRIREVMEKYRKAFGVPEKERIQLAKEIWKLILDELWGICLVANSPASQGVRLVKNYMGNIPQRQWNSAVSENPAIAHPETFYFKQ